MVFRLLSLCLLGLAVEAAAIAGERQPLAGKTLDGGHFSLAEQGGRVVVIHYWATWCIPCRVEMPVLDAYYRRNRDRGLTMLAIGLDAGGPVKKLRAATSGFSFPVARVDDLDMPRSAIPTGLPDTRIYDRAGVLRFDSKSLKGKLLDAATLDRVVARLLAQGHGPS